MHVDAQRRERSMDLKRQHTIARFGRDLRARIGDRRVSSICVHASQRDMGDLLCTAFKKSFIDLGGKRMHPSVRIRIVKYFSANQ
jgi:hypothetical protein